MTTANQSKPGGILSTRNMVRISLLSLLGAILTIINAPIPIFPVFLKLDMGDVPTVVALLMMGPIPAIIVQVMGVVVKFIVAGSETGGIGELANIIIGVSYILPFGVVFSLLKNNKYNFLAGAITGSVMMAVAGAVANIFLLLPLYASWMGGMEQVIAFAEIAGITDVTTLIVMGIIPFNLVKGAFTSLVGYFVYRSIKPILHRL